MIPTAQRRESLKVVEATVSRLRAAAMDGEVRLMEQVRAELLEHARWAGVDVRAPIRDLELMGYRHGLLRALTDAEEAAERGDVQGVQMHVALARQCAFRTGDAIDRRVAQIEARL
jgi:hypothetical protein